MIKLRRFYTQDQLATIYARQYNPHQWPEHTSRIASTIEIVQALIDTNDIKTCADFSAGDRSVTAGLTGLDGLETSDGHIESDTLWMEPVDLFICTETIEHLEAPWTVLERVATKAKWIVLSCPLDENPAIGNHEHYWSFTATDVESMLHEAGFIDRSCQVLSQFGWTYSYQVWTARSIYA